MGQVLGQPFNNPERQLCKLTALLLRREIELEDVHELVTDDVIVVRIDAGQRKHDPVEGGFGEPARTLANQAGRHDGLLKIRMVAIDDQRFLAVELVVEKRGEPHMPALGEVRNVRGVVGLRRVVVNQVVLRLEHLELEAFPQHLVAAEVLRLARRGREKRDQAPGQRGAHRPSECSAEKGTDPSHLVAPGFRRKLIDAPVVLTRRSALASHFGPPRAGIPRQARSVPRARSTVSATRPLGSALRVGAR